MKRMLIVLLAGVTLCFAGCTGNRENRDNGGDGENTRATDAKTEQTANAVTDAEPTGTRSDYSKNY